MRNKKIVIASRQNPDSIRKKKKEKLNKRCCIEKHHFEFLLDKIYSNFEENDKIILFNKILLNVLLYYTGLRINEVLLLNKKNILSLIKFEKLDVYCKKTKDYRTVFLQGEIKNKFLNHFKHFDLEKDIHELGLVNKHQKKLTFLTAFRWMDKYFDMLEKEFGGQVALLKGRAWGFHSYRINYINQMIRNIDLPSASKIIGHKNIETTLIYFRNLPISEDKINVAINNADF